MTVTSSHRPEGDSPAQHSVPEERLHSQIRFLDLDFTVASQTAWRDLLLSGSRDDPGFRYLVTPNVDHVVQISKKPEIGAIYQHADWMMCDSRILEKLAAARGITLRTYPGADLLRDTLEAPRAPTRRIAIIGPDQTHFDILRQRYPDHELVHVEAPFMKPGEPAWEATLAATEAAQADLYMLCLSFPKQEIFARDLKLRGRIGGIGLCAGAGVDFLTGQQTRAPMFLRSIGMEWAYRLLSNPGRMWKRYLVDGPKIFALYLRARSQ